MFYILLCNITIAFFAGIRHKVTYLLFAENLNSKKTQYTNTFNKLKPLTVAAAWIPMLLELSRRKRLASAVLNDDDGLQNNKILS